MTCCKRILFLLFIFIFLFFTFSFAANPQPVDPTGSFVTSEGGYSEQRDNVYYTLLEYQANVQRRFITKCYSNINNSSYRTMLNALYQQMDGYGSNGKFFVIIEQYKGYSGSYAVYTSYTGDLSRSVADQYIADNTAFAHVATYTGTFYNIVGVADGPYVSNPIYSKTETLTQPVAFCRSLVPEFIQLFKDFGIITDVSNNNVVNAINKTNDELKNEISNSADKINDNINNNDVSDVDTSGITNADTTVDITQNGFNSIFNTLHSYFTSNSGGSLTFTLPFVNKSITISKATVFGNFIQLSTIENFASLVWYFVISLYIVKSIQRMINKIKSGNLEEVVDNNIKADIL